ncbi:MAG: protein-glutamate O-methyltransferase CheR [Bacteroidales bacterium]|nr:protein-glutamate O-methyltransferase CheR [Bacteroidales bacterium]
MSDNIVTITDEELSFFIGSIRTFSDYDFTEYSEKSFKRRIEKVLMDYKLDLNSLILKMRKESDFLERIIKDITVNTTELFRDPKAWHTLKYRILPRLKDNNVINIWHAGCSTGQEVYSMLILLNEMGLIDKAKVYATDLNTDVIDVAKAGIYKYRFNLGYLDSFDKVIKENPYNYDEFKEVPYEKYFDIDKVQDSIKMKQFLKDKPVFRKHDLVKGGNIFYTKFDIIMCRNVLIYFNNSLQNKVFELFYKSLFDGGYLVLGIHESMLGPMTSKFEKKGSNYRKKLL